MFGFSLGELIFISILALVVIGPKQLPEVARNIARFLNELKRTSAGITNELKQQAKFDLNPKMTADPLPPVTPTVTHDHPPVVEAHPHVVEEPKKSDQV